MALHTLGLGPAWVPLLERAIAGLDLGPRGEVQASSLGRIAEYLDQLVRWNQKTDLTAARSPEELVDLSLADALVLAHGVAEGGAPGSTSGETWVDVGSGAGAPGLVVALLRPGLTVTLVEPRDKRVAFLRSVVGSLSITNATVVRGRSDVLSPHSWDVAVARATLPPPEWLREGARLSRRAVWVLLARDEAPSLDGYRVDIDQRYHLPLTGSGRRAVRYVRVSDDAIDDDGASCEK